MSTLTWAIIETSVNNITLSWILDSSFISIIFSIISVFLWLIMWIATYLISTSIPNISKINDLEDIIIKKKILKDITDLTTIKKGIQTKLKFIYISVVLIPIILVIIFYLKLTLIFFIILAISIIYYLILFIYISSVISKIIHLNINLETYQKEILEKSIPS